MAESNLNRLKDVLSELFMLDKADLDFGIHRIMNVKRDELRAFIDNDLLPQVKSTLAEVGAGQQAAAKAEYDAARAEAQKHGDPELSPMVAEAKRKWKDAGDPEANENEVFSHLADFFRRYYKDGDFLSLRRYKKDVYAIPYEGEEVKLHWANADQYYIKSSEQFRDYTWKLNDGRRVHFKLAAADTEANNNKAAAGQERRFILCAENAIAVDDAGELVIRFEYRPDSESRKRETLNAAAVDAILKDALADWKAALAAKAATAKDPDRTLLAKHLGDYTAKNSFDYFIHKDLGGFLRRELDFYIKNEVMHLDDIESETAAKVEQYLSKIKAIRRIAHKIIDMLAQLEDFQKKLWLKKKFVVETNYCVTLDRVPEELYPEIAANDAQREEWVRLFAIDEIKGDMAQPAYSVPLTVDFLKSQPHLVLDTAFFDATDRILGSMVDVESETSGALVRSENFQALQLLALRFKDAVRCAYIDPPYNIGDDGFAYKDNYQHSSWASMMRSRLVLCREMLEETAALFTSVDDHEQPNLRFVGELAFGEANFAADIIWNARKSVSNDALISLAHHHTLMFVRNLQCLADRKTEFRLPADDSKFSNPDHDTRGPWKLDPFDAPGIRPNLTYPIKNPTTGQEHMPPVGRCWRYPPDEYARLFEDKRILFGRAGNSKPGLKSFLSEAKEKGLVPTTLWTDVPTTTDGTKELLALFGRGEKEAIDQMKPKPTGLLTKIGALTSDGSGVFLDFFAGSGTTADAVLKLNRDDEGDRRFLLVEVADYFETLLKPRIQKVIYSKDWKDGKPVSRQGSSHMFKYIRLESYEDTLNNLDIQRTDGQQALLDANVKDGDGKLREDYVLKYMLDVETKGSPSLLNLDKFDDPFNYILNIATGSAGETKPTKVDLVETFNYLIGLRVRTIDRIQGFRVITGESPAGEKVLVIWRSVAENDNAALDAFFSKQKYNPRDNEYDVIYVNGDNNLENLRTSEETWKVRLIEEDFLRLMFDVKDV